MKPKTVILVVVLLLVLVILFQNTQVVTLRLLFWKISMSQILWTSTVLLVGFVCGYVAAKLWGRRRRAEQRIANSK